MSWRWIPKSLSYTNTETKSSKFFDFEILILLEVEKSRSKNISLKVEDPISYICLLSPLFCLATRKFHLLLLLQQFPQIFL